jgi:hypothetical protein
MDTILEILLGESYNNIRVLADLSLCVLIIPTCMEVEYYALR